MDGLKRRMQSKDERKPNCLFKMHPFSNGKDWVFRLEKDIRQLEGDSNSWWYRRTYLLDSPDPTEKGLEVK